MYSYLYVQFFILTVLFILCTVSIIQKSLSYTIQSFFIYLSYCVLVPSIYSTVPFIYSRNSKIIFYIIKLNFIMRITEKFSLCYAEVGVGVDDF